MGDWRRMRPWLGLGAAFLAGGIPFANIAARLTSGTDLRGVGNGTVSGTGLYRVAGFGPLAVAGVLEIGKGAVGPLLVGRDHPTAAALAAGLSVAGHNWSPFLRGAGGRGISPALGALLVVAWPGAVLLLAGMILGKVFGETALGALVAEVALTPVLAVIYGAVGALAGASIAMPMLVKRVVGNTPPAPPRGHTYLTRLLYDRDERVATDAS